MIQHKNKSVKPIKTNRRKGLPSRLILRLCILLFIVVICIILILLVVIAVFGVVVPVVVSGVSAFVFLSHDISP
jgi:uncharacterized membrane protein